MLLYSEVPRTQFSAERLLIQITNILKKKVTQAISNRICHLSSTNNNSPSTWGWGLPGGHSSLEKLFWKSAISFSYVFIP